MLATRSTSRIVAHEQPDVIEVGSAWTAPWLIHLARRRVLAAEGIGVIAHDVGYDSLSQFNRDYRKLYGKSPSQDLAALRNHAA